MGRTEPTLLDRLADLEQRLAALEGNVGKPIYGSGGGLDADMVDGIHAAAIATANKLLALNANAKLPADVAGDADTVDSKHASQLQIVCASNIDNTASSTTSTTYVDKLSLSITLAAQSSIIILAAFERRAASASYAVYYRTTLAGTAQHEISFTGTAYSREHFIEIARGQAAGTYAVKLQYRASNSGYAAYIRNAVLIALAIPE